MKKYKSPFSIYVIWHPAFEAGGKVADYLYASFTRDTEAPLNRGIGIPVYYRSKPERGSLIPKSIKLSEADYNAIIVLVDDHLFNDDKWNAFILKAKVDTSKQKIILHEGKKVKFFSKEKLNDLIGSLAYSNPFLDAVVEFAKN